MFVMFTLLPKATDLDRLLAAQPPVAAMWPEVRCRRYPAATDGKHLLSLVRAGRDRQATRWLRGLTLAIIGGAILGALLNGVLASVFDMLGGLVELAIPFGFVLGAFLGAFTALMTGTEVARDEVVQLGKAVRSGDVLLQLQIDTREQLRILLAWCEQNEMACSYYEI